MIIEPTCEPDQATATVGYTSACDLREKYRNGELSPASVVQDLLDRIEVINGEGDIELKAVIEVSETVLREAESITPNDEKALWGIPIIVKDNIEVEGWVSGAGSDVFTLPATKDADLITTLRNAGALMLANANLTEWVASATQTLEEGQSTRGGLTGNPWALDRSAGSSSSGSAAAVAAGLAPVAIGTETVESLCQPASHCGVFAMKATRGAIPTRGLIPYSATQDVPGVFARELDDIRLVMATLLGRDLPYAEHVRIRFGIDSDLEDPSQSDEALLEAYRELCEFLSETGHQEAVIPRIPQPEYARLERVLKGEIVRDLTSYLAQRPGSRWKSLSDALILDFPSASCGAFEAPPYFEAFADALAQAPMNIAKERKAMEKVFASLLEDMLAGDDLIMAVAYGIPSKLDLSRITKRAAYGYHSFLGGISSTAGWPALTIPFTEIRGLPVGLILVARPDKEEHLLGAAKWLSTSFLLGAAKPPSWRPPQRG